MDGGELRFGLERPSHFTNDLTGSVPTHDVPIASFGGTLLCPRLDYPWAAKDDSSNQRDWDKSEQDGELDSEQSGETDEDGRSNKSDKGDEEKNLPGGCGEGVMRKRGSSGKPGVPAMGDPPPTYRPLTPIRSVYAFHPCFNDSCERSRLVGLGSLNIFDPSAD